MYTLMNDQESITRLAYHCFCVTHGRYNNAYSQDHDRENLYPTISVQGVSKNLLYHLDGSSYFFPIKEPNIIVVMLPPLRKIMCTGTLML